MLSKLFLGKTKKLHKLQLQPKKLSKIIKTFCLNFQKGSSF